MGKLILTILLLMPFNGYLDDKAQVKVYTTIDRVFHQIVHNKPSIDRRFAFRLSGTLTRYAELHQMDPHRAAAIAMQESAYRKHVISRNRSSFDYGMFQFNTVTIREYKLDSKKLVEDLEYTVSAYFTVMKDKKKLCEKLESDAWSCYHSKTPVHRLKYKKLVNKYYHVNVRKITQWK